VTTVDVTPRRQRYRALINEKTKLTEILTLLADKQKLVELS
jgi:hypothetical protein